VNSVPGDTAALGVGLVWSPALDPLCRGRLVDVVEVEPETLWLRTPDGGFTSYARPALAHLPQPKLLHGVAGPVGGTCLPIAGHAETLAGDIAALKPAMVSDHLSLTHFTPSAGEAPAFAGFLLPPLQSSAGVRLAAANIRRRQAMLGDTPFAVETPVSYLPPAPGEWPDGAFVAAVIEAANCGLLLDLHNVLCNARNGRQSVRDFCAALPLERVWELHLAGGEAEAGFWLDAHAGLADDELMELAAWLVPQLPGLRAIIFEIVAERIPAVGLDAIAGQLEAMRRVWETRGSAPRHERLAGPAPTADPEIGPGGWERLLGAALLGQPEPPLGASMAQWRRGAAPALDLYQKLAGEARASAVAAGAPLTTRALLKAHGGAGTRRLLADFWRGAPPGRLTIDEARSFLRYVAAAQPDCPGLSSAIEADAAMLGGL
jgi:uncharacterized protein